MVHPCCVVNLESGQILAGTLRLVRKIAEGGMGSVWVAEHLVLCTEVAVKFMSRPWALVPNASTRFLREARMTAKLESPHIVRVLDCRLTEGDEPYLVLELLRGMNLEQHVRRYGLVPLEAVVSIVCQTCEALTCVHDKGIVHRDIKPENIFLEDHGGSDRSVKLLDFGVAKPKNNDECLDVDRLPAGTVQYMSPEHMFDPETTDERSDLFSLGAVAYFTLTGRPPFDTESLEALYFAIDGGSFERPSKTLAGLPKAVDDWFAKALAHRPEHRFRSAREMAESLLRATRREVRTIAPPRRTGIGGVGRTYAARAVTATLLTFGTAGLLAWDGPPQREALAHDVDHANERTMEPNPSRYFLTSAPRELRPPGELGDQPNGERSDALLSDERKPTIR